MAGLQGSRSSLLSCAATAAEQPDGQPVQDATKRCLSCGNEHMLFYFPVRTSHPDGWVHCYACQHAQRQKVNPISRCTIICWQ